MATPPDFTIVESIFRKRLRPLVPESQGDAMTANADGLSAAHLAELWHLARQLQRCDTVSEAEALALDAMNRSDRSTAMEHAIADTVGPALESIRERQRLRSLAIRDPLTGLFNRSFMEEELIRLIHHMTRAGRPMAVAMLDLDHFGNHNSDHGHRAGDVVLQCVAGLFQGFRRGSDVACRYGGDEFVLIMPEATAIQAAARIDPLCRRLAATTLPHERRLVPPVTVSVGVAEFPTHGTTSVALLEAADTALYRAKAAGRNRICQASAAGDEPVRGDAGP
jgi:diguanylate cyclase (GGDEF)-like protein